MPLINALIWPSSVLMFTNIIPLFVWPTIFFIHFVLNSSQPNDIICATKICQHWFRLWFVAWWHQAITWTIVNFSLMRFCGICPRAISQQVPKLLFCTMTLKIILLKLLPHLPVANELSLRFDVFLTPVFLFISRWVSGPFQWILRFGSGKFYHHVKKYLQNR